MLYRQGDVLIERIAKAPKAKSVKPEHGLLILARGEATGHHHSIPAGAGMLALDDGGVMYLTVEELTAVTHQEHAPITLDPGTYKVTVQREWDDAQEPRRVAD